MQKFETLLQDQRNYFATGATHSLSFRLEQLRRLRLGILNMEDEIAEALKQDLNKSRFESYETEIGIVLHEITHAEKHLAKWMRPRRVKTPLLSFPGKSRIYSEPYGSVLILSPWNYPFQLSLAPLAGALAAGNCAVIKPAKDSPATSAIIQKLLRGCFDEKYVAVVQSSQISGAQLLEHRFDYIFFTGSIPVGKKVMEAASRYLTPVSLELGGKSPCIVDKTADLDAAARRIAWGKCLNAGQTCVAPDYLLVHTSVRDALLQKLESQIKTFYGEEPHRNGQYPKIINQHHYTRLKGLIQTGGRVVFGGVWNDETLQICPTALVDVNEDMPVMQQEIFGPIFPVLCYDEISQAIAFAAHRPKPLAFYLFTKDKLTEKEILRSLSFGGGSINDTIMHMATPYMPFGGVGDSGMGGYHGQYSFFTFSNQKSVLKKLTGIETSLRYPPYKASSQSLLRKFLR